ncbi:hypothetical protein [Psychrobacter sp. Ps2]|uniref:hypothetical protein n=1 Tax=Psychrobacter sp. Ps2 TaxID=2790956 RepID=UPI001EDFD4D0|nr:hypothetical protein [Psychrobacter sp. Ps2]MCG3857327.1 hypothetical protein [Psychrobacter sp. Ps2]
MLKIYTYHPSRISNELSAIVQNAVLPGLKTGLEKLGIDYDYQPNKPIANGDKVLVMSDHLLWRELIETKRNDTNFTLLAGPIFEIEDTHRHGLEHLINTDGIPNPFLILNRLDSVLVVF